MCVKEMRLISLVFFVRCPGLLLLLFFYSIWSSRHVFYILPFFILPFLIAITAAAFVIQIHKQNTKTNTVRDYSVKTVVSIITVVFKIRDRSDHQKNLKRNRKHKKL